jgi:magnesium transporter
MAEILPVDQQERHLDALARALESGTLTQVRQVLGALQPAEIAHLLESVPPSQRLLVWGVVDREEQGEVLLQVGDEVRAGLLETMDREHILSALEGLDVDDVADLLAELPDTVTRQVLAGMDKQDRERLEAVLSYAEDTAGGLMNTDTVTVRADVDLDVVLRYLRMRGGIPPQTDSLFVVDRYGHYQGTLPLVTILTRDPNQLVSQVMDTDIEGIRALTPAAQVAILFEDRDLISAPVVDEEGRLLGRITVDDVVDVIREEGEHELFSMAGLPEEEDLFAPVIPSTRRRAIWLGVNLLTAFIASWVISLFEDTLERVVALAVLMPIVASMGGIAGGQTLTLVVRGLALGQVGKTNARTLFTKEMAVGALNGLIWALLVAALSALWFHKLQIGAIIAVAMVINLICAAVAGVSIPILMRSLGVDPAIAGGVLLTTVTDVVGYLSFLGLATLFLL